MQRVHACALFASVGILLIASVTLSSAIKPPTAIVANMRLDQLLPPVEEKCIQKQQSTSFSYPVCICAIAASIYVVSKLLLKSSPLEPDKKGDCPPVTSFFTNTIKTPVERLTTLFEAFFIAISRLFHVHSGIPDQTAAVNDTIYALQSIQQQVEAQNKQIEKIERYSAQHMIQLSIQEVTQLLKVNVTTRIIDALKTAPTVETQEILKQFSSPITDADIEIIRTKYTSFYTKALTHMYNETIYQVRKNYTLKIQTLGDNLLSSLYNLPQPNTWTESQYKSMTTLITYHNDNTCSRQLTLLPNQLSKKISITNFLSLLT